MADLVLRPTCNHWPGTTFTALKKPIAAGAFLPARALPRIEKAVGAAGMPLNISGPGSKLKTKVISGLRRPELMTRIGIWLAAFIVPILSGMMWRGMAFSATV